MWGGGRSSSCTGHLGLTTSQRRLVTHGAEHKPGRDGWAIVTMRWLGNRHRAFAFPTSLSGKAIHVPPERVWSCVALLSIRVEYPRWMDRSTVGFRVSRARVPSRWIGGVTEAVSGSLGRIHLSGYGVATVTVARERLYRLPGRIRYGFLCRAPPRSQPALSGDGHVPASPRTHRGASSGSVERNRTPPAPPRFPSTWGGRFSTSADSPHL